MVKFFRKILLNKGGGIDNNGKINAEEENKEVQGRKRENSWRYKNRLSPGRGLKKEDCRRPAGKVVANNVERGDFHIIIAPPPNQFHRVISVFFVLFNYLVYNKLINNC